MRNHPNFSATWAALFCEVTLTEGKENSWHPGDVLW